MKPLNILIACERFGAVRDAFIKRGHNAVSCDILDTEIPGPHHKGYLEDFIGNGSEWDFIIGFPPCTYICSSGLHHNGKVPGRSEKTTAALIFVAFMANCMRNARYGGWIENPVGCISTRIYFDPNESWNDSKGCYTVLDLPNPKFGFKSTQTIQPYEYGHDASKKTCLWRVVGNSDVIIPWLMPIDYVLPRIVNGKERWGNQTDSGQNKLGPSEDRAAIRGMTYPGIAKAMADQWGGFLEKYHK